MRAPVVGVEDAQRPGVPLIGQQLDDLAQRDRRQIAGQQQPVGGERARLADGAVRRSGRQRERLGHGRRRRRSPERAGQANHARDHRLQRLRREGLADGVDDVGRPGEALFQIGRLPARDHHDHRDAGQLRLIGQLAAEIGGVAPRDEAVEEDQLGHGARLAYQRQRRLAVRRREHPVTRLGERPLDDLLHRRAVVDHQ